MSKPVEIGIQNPSRDIANPGAQTHMPSIQRAPEGHWSDDVQRRDTNSRLPDKHFLIIRKTQSEKLSQHSEISISYLLFSNSAF